MSAGRVISAGGKAVGRSVETVLVGAGLPGSGLTAVVAATAFGLSVVVPAATFGMAAGAGTTAGGGVRTGGATRYLPGVPAGSGTTIMTGGMGPAWHDEAQAGFWQARWWLHPADAANATANPSHARRRGGDIGVLPFGVRILRTGATVVAHRLYRPGGLSHFGEGCENGEGPGSGRFGPAGQAGAGRVASLGRRVLPLHRSARPAYPAGIPRLGRGTVPVARVRKQWHLVPHDRPAGEPPRRRRRRRPGRRPAAAQPRPRRPGRRPPLPRRPARRLAPARTAARRARRGRAVCTPPSSPAGKICVYGDYDVDGVTGTAILLRRSRPLGAKAEFYIPHRIEEGYGLNAEALRRARGRRGRVVVTVDCGITEPRRGRRGEAARAGADRHRPPRDEGPAAGRRRPRPPAAAGPRLPVRRPVRGGRGASSWRGPWPSGSAAATKVDAATSGRSCSTPSAFAALGLVADVVPLHDENRILVRARPEPLAA